MSLLGLHPRREVARSTAQSRCVLECANLQETEHARHHLLVDFAKAFDEARRQRRPINMRFAIFEQGCEKSLHDGVLRCSYKESSMQLISSVDVAQVMQVIRELIGECNGIHLSSLRDIHTERPRTVYVAYEIQVEPGFQLPSK